MPVLPENHPILVNLTGALQTFDPRIFFQKQIGLALPKKIFVQGLVGVEDLVTMRTTEGTLLYQSNKLVPLLTLALDTEKDPALTMTPVLEEVCYLARIEELIKHLAAQTQSIIEGRPI